MPFKDSVHDEFSFGNSEGLETLNLQTQCEHAEKRVIKILEAVYGQEKAKRSLKEQATIQLHACTDVEQQLERRVPYWQAVTYAVCHTLEEYPLKG